MAIKNLPVEECMIPGSAACPGCPATMALRIVFKAIGKNMIMVVPACCTAVIESLYPNTSFDVPVMNIAFEAAAAGASGVEAALRQQGKDDTTVVAWAGDGGTYDIGHFPVHLNDRLTSSIYVITIRYIQIQAFNEVELPHMEHGQQQQLAVKRNSEKKWGKLSKRITYLILPKHVSVTLKISIIS